jgi:hypothetical protein
MPALTYVYRLAIDLRHMGRTIETLDPVGGLLIYSDPASGTRTTVRARWSKRGDRLLVREYTSIKA